MAPVLLAGWLDMTKVQQATKGNGAPGWMDVDGGQEQALGDFLPRVSMLVSLLAARASSIDSLV